MPRRKILLILPWAWTSRWAGLATLAALGLCLWLARTTAALPPEHDVRNTVRTILARREFVPPQPSLLDSLREATARAVGELLEWLFRPLEWLVRKLTEIAGNRSPVAVWMVAGLLMGLLLLVIFHIYYMASGAFRTERARRARGPGTAFRPHAHDLLEHARAAATAGQFRDAVRLMYQATLRLLDQAGIIRYDPFHTNWDYAHQVGAREHLGPIFAQLTSIADRAMYSDAPVTQEHYVRADEFFARTRELLK
ncbi:MAG: DUF4129 domain-containing protein [Armatimonadetes bacterium]|nr:DUF4129 domain-containing protein [Armatimonadota bacterium]